MEREHERKMEKIRQEHRQVLAETREQYEAEVSTGLYEAPAAEGLLIQLAALGHKVGTPHSCQEDGTQLPTSSFGTSPGASSSLGLEFRPLY